VATGVAYSPLAATIPNVAAATATVYSDFWPMMGTYEKEFYGIANETNPYLTGEKGKWRQRGSYTFKTNTTLSTEWSKMAHNSGYFPYTKFDYLTLSNNTSNYWNQGNQVFEYSPNGEILEEQNHVGIISAAKFAHKENVPAIIAQNARFSNILFASFEDKSHASIIADKTFAHTGNNCVAIEAGQVLDPTLTSYIELYGNLELSQGLLLKYWARSKSGANQALGLTVKKNDASSQLITFNQSLKNMLRVGEWTLYETYISFPQGALNSGTPIRVELNNSSSETIYVDDYKLQPAKSEATCYVYDNASLRLLATFDDRHFAMIYQYDAEGKLVRKLVETERGVKTISETQYNTPSVSR
jgi:YD repeat-containing protein